MKSLPSVSSNTLSHTVSFCPVWFTLQSTAPTLTHRSLDVWLCGTLPLCFWCPAAAFRMNEWEEGRKEGRERGERKEAKKGGSEWGNGWMTVLNGDPNLTRIKGELSTIWAFEWSSAPHAGHRAKAGSRRHHLMEFMISTVCMDDDVFVWLCFQIHDPTSFVAGD